MKRREFLISSTGVVTVAGTSLIVPGGLAEAAGCGPCSLTGQNGMPPDPSWAGVPGGQQWKDSMGCSCYAFDTSTTYTFSLIRGAPEMTFIERMADGVNTAIDAAKAMLDAVFGEISPKPEPRNVKYKALAGSDGKVDGVWLRKRRRKVEGINYQVDRILYNWRKYNLGGRDAMVWIFRHSYRLNAWEGEKLVRYVNEHMAGSPAALRTVDGVPYFYFRSGDIDFS